MNGMEMEATHLLPLMDDGKEEVDDNLDKISTHLRLQNFLSAGSGSPGGCDSHR